MAINASAKSSAPKKLPPEGTHIARCYQIIDQGTIDDEYNGKHRKVRKVRISWELPKELAVFREDDGPQPFAVHSTYTLSLSEKSHLRHDLETWRGQKFTIAELAKFDVCKVLGVPCMVVVSHVVKGENTYANVTAVTALPKGIVCPPAINPPVEYSTESHSQSVFDALPDFLKELIRASDEWKARQNTPAEDDIPWGDDSAPTAEEEKALPF